jgi:hyperosmotically inducible periplasmic protein
MKNFLVVNKTWRVSVFFGCGNVQTVGQAALNVNFQSVEIIIEVLIMSFYAKLSGMVALAMLSLGFSESALADEKQDLIDARQETQIWTTYALNPYLRASDLKVSVKEGKAIISGKVEEDVSKELAKEIALGVSGIKSVDNQIVVEDDYKPNAERGYREAVDDVSISAAVRSRLVWSKHSYKSAKVETKDGRVTLSGTVNNSDAKELAGRLARNTRGVKSVDNQLKIDSKPAGDTVKEAARDAEKAVADAWITAKVKSNFLYSTNVSAGDINVDTSAGKVFLKGRVSSGAERALAIELAQNVRGVKQVDAAELTFQ